MNNIITITSYTVLLYILSFKMKIKIVSEKE